MSNVFLALVVLFLVNYSLKTSVQASAGDKHYLFRACRNHCQQINCSTSSGLQDFYQKQSLAEQFIQWTCPDECAYECMWKTVEHMTSQGEDVVQFHGKWPFVRFLGLQEPASAVFSLLNFASHFVFGYLAFHRRLLFGVHPLYSMWFAFWLISMNAWIWSTVFHARETPLTEKLDYISAVSLVFSQFACCLMRIGYGLGYLRLSLVPTFLLIVFFIYHAHYLLVINMDYGYNMIVNIIVGLLNVICWLTWSAANFAVRRKYVWRCALSVFLVAVFVGFESFDFAPIRWTIDAHALWHLLTIPLPFLWYQFIVDDSRYLLTHAY